MDERSAVPYVIGPDGEKLTRDDLPGPSIRRWVPRRKARVVAAVEGGLISREEACALYQISDEEFDSWRARLTRHGLRGLRVTKISQWRGTYG